MNVLLSKGWRWLLGVGILILVSACSTIDYHHTQATLDRRAQWLLLPLVNHSETPQAGQRAAAVAELLLRRAGIDQLVRYPSTALDDAADADDERIGQEALTWAKQQTARYAITGSVEEWRYKSGLDAEPAVALHLQVIELTSGQVVWSAGGAKTGWGRESVSVLGQQLLRELLATLPPTTH